MVYVPEADRTRLDGSRDLHSVTQAVERHTVQQLPRDAIVLDEDISGYQLLDALKQANLHYDTGRPGLAQFDRIEPICASHIFSQTEDRPLLRWADSRGYPILTGNVQDFPDFHAEESHSGLFVCLEQEAAQSKASSVASEMDDIVSNERKACVVDSLFTIDP